MALKITPASQYTLEELTGFYNQTRVDYLVPMPMSPDVMGEYIHDFDVDLALSPVIHDAASGKFFGLGMLGVRDDRTWITRLGVTPASRRSGAGGAAMDTMMENSCKIGAKKVVLEVIKNNTPAQTLFKKSGFQQTIEFLVLRRAPLRPPLSPEGEITWLYRNDALDALRSYPHPLTWINAIESMENASMFQGFSLKMKSGAKAWMVYRHKKHSITHFVFHTERGNPAKMARNLLLYLHLQYHRMDAYAENFFADDPHLPAFFDLGYFEAFRRIEMTNDSI
jgi:ribosomal protein S18 acetylase RimI-like enzyme